jgi:uncharacterized cupredoxin-like copper-binding protein
MSAPPLPMAGEYHFGCLLPGHFEAGMIGQIRVLARGEKK